MARVQWRTAKATWKKAARLAVMPSSEQQWRGSSGQGPVARDQRLGLCGAPPRATPKKAARPAVMPSSAQLRRLWPLKPRMCVPVKLTAAPQSASRAASGPRLAPAHVRHPETLDAQPCDAHCGLHRASRAVLVGRLAPAQAQAPACARLWSLMLPSTAPAGLPRPRLASSYADLKPWMCMLDLAWAGLLCTSAAQGPPAEGGPQQEDPAHLRRWRTRRPRTWRAPAPGAQSPSRGCS